MLLVNRTRAILRSAELGFLGVWVLTCTHTPRRCGQDCSAGLEVLYLTALRPLRTNWLIVGICFRSFYFFLPYCSACQMGKLVRTNDDTNCPHSGKENYRFEQTKMNF